MADRYQEYLTMPYLSNCCFYNKTLIVVTEKLRAVSKTPYKTIRTTKARNWGNEAAAVCDL